ncbi:Putative aminoacrylate hydrolase RutD [Aliiroseovarius pelagivivens]|uniref:Aminoacrylate hydrolase RutD n=1 Tax=Aliiroseovarius pelagivivens TaxID=1639690 RepID=A0A2R8AIN1_9RHOB|nr:alpha/beta fold hydrolase [Aliiroseovarius pelagivivens]SPF75749.1 Putative aminoacrylate hydrolase RutD [Aliiroseovarius pelagivivens]
MTPLVLLPGMMCDARLFAPQVAALSGCRTVICASLAERSSVEELALDILADAPQCFALAGLSMGGIVAMEILRQAPERVERIALLDTNPLAETDEVKARRIPQMMAVKVGKLSVIMRDEMKPNYLSEGPRRGEVLDLCMDMALDLGPHVFLNQSRALMDRSDQTETLRNATVPALILCGREDTLCPVARHEMMAGLIPGARLEIIDGAGHLPTLEQPEKTNAALARWLEE